MTWLLNVSPWIWWTRMPEPIWTSSLKFWPSLSLSSSLSRRMTGWPVRYFGFIITSFSKSLIFCRATSWWRRSFSFWGMRMGPRRSPWWIPWNFFLFLPRRCSSQLGRHGWFRIVRRTTMTVGMIFQWSVVTPWTSPLYSLPRTALPRSIIALSFCLKKKCFVTNKLLT